MRLLFDIGANAGHYADANAAKYDKMILVEANPQLCRALQDKYRHNPRFMVENRLVSKDKNVPFYLCPNHTFSTAAIRWTKESRFVHMEKWHPSPEPIACVTVDELVKTHGKPTYIKIDVEGYEYNVLQSMTEKYCPLAFEWAEELVDEIFLSLDYLASLGYQEFAVQHADAYMYEPQNHEYHSLDQIKAQFEEHCDPKQRMLWGMVHCR
jgi:FkbM family methyltransferase